MEEYLCFERIYRMILGKLEVTEDNLKLPDDDFEENKNIVNMKIKNFINKAVLEFGFVEFLLKLDELFEQLNFPHNNDANVFRYEILELRNLVVKYFMPEVYAKIVFLATKDELTKDFVIKVLKSNICNINDLLGTGYGVTSELSEMFKAMQYKENMKNECFYKINHLMNKSQFMEKMVEIEKVIYSINTPLSNMFLDLIEKATEELIAFINKVIGKHKVNELQLVLPGFYN